MTTTLSQTLPDDDGQNAVRRFIDTHLRKEMKLRFSRAFEALRSRVSLRNFYASCVELCATARWSILVAAVGPRCEFQAAEEI